MRITLENTEVARIVQSYLETIMPGHVVIVDEASIYGTLRATASNAEDLKQIEDQPVEVAAEFDANGR